MQNPRGKMECQRRLPGREGAQPESEGGGGPGEKAFQPEGSKWAKAQVCETPQVSVLCVPACEDSGGGGGVGRGQKAHAAEGWQASGEGGLAGSGQGECGERSSRVPLAGQREARGEDTGEVLAVVSRPSPALAAGGAQTPLQPRSRSSPLCQALCWVPGTPTSAVQRDRDGCTEQKAAGDTGTSSGIGEDRKGTKLLCPFSSIASVPALCRGLG